MTAHSNVKPGSIGLGNQLAEARILSGLSRSQLAAHVGLSAEMIRSIESGRRLPSFKTLDVLCTALGVTFHISLTRNKENSHAGK